MSTWIDGPMKWSAVRDKEGYVEYTVTHLVATDSAETGPSEIMQTPGLPQPGSVWSFDDDSDVEAYCKIEMNVTQLRENEPNYRWLVEQKFSNGGDLKKCKDQQVTNPLMEPQKVSGNFSKLTVEATTDRFGRFIRNSAHEQMRGAQVEFDEGRPSIKIEQNVPLLELNLLAQAKDCVNKLPMWGFPPRTIKLSGVSWDKKYYGLCNAYYTRNFDFEINFDTWDRDLLDEGTKVLHGEWSNITANWNVTTIPTGITPDRFNPQHFIRFKDRHGENSKVVLDGFGTPWIPPEAAAKKWWCIVNLDNPDELEVFFGTCEAAKARASVPTRTITNMTGTDVQPIVVTTSGAHGFDTGDEVVIQGVRGNANANGIWTVTVLSPTTFSIPDNGTAAYSGGGTATKNLNYVIAGPENTEAAINAICVANAIGGGVYLNPSQLVCDTLNAPGTIHVEKYGECDFFMFGLPATI